jgi:hypothetical protein
LQLAQATSNKAYSPARTTAAYYVSSHTNPTSPSVEV